MIAEWRLFLLALRYFTRRPVPGSVLLRNAPFNSAARDLPLVGVKGRLGAHPGDFLGATQQLTEIGFYLGALATWTYT
jgi:cobalamin synthase